MRYLGTGINYNGFTIVNFHRNYDMERIFKNPLIASSDTLEAYLIRARKTNPSNPPLITLRDHRGFIVDNDEIFDAVDILYEQLVRNT